jgi:hypothetical protein
MDDLVLVAAFVKSANVSELRQTLHLPVHLGKREAEFIRAADLIFEHLGKGSSPGQHGASTSNFAVSWVEGLNAHLRDCQRVIDAALAD